MDDELRELLSRKASEIPSQREVPAMLVKRAHRRTATNFLMLGAAAVLLVGGTFVGIRVLGGPEPVRPIPPAASHSAEPTPSEPTPSTTPSTTPTTSDRKGPCSAGQLRAVGTFEGAAGSREGTIEFSNLSDETCTLEGTPKITLFDDNQQPINDGVVFSASPSSWEANAKPQPEGWPTVTLAPGDVASVRVRWSNWCPDGRNAPLWRVQIPGDTTVDVNGFDAAGPPPCNGGGQPSTIEVGPFEP